MAKLSFTILIFTLLSVLDSVDTFDRITINLLRGNTDEIQMQAAKILVITLLTDAFQKFLIKVIG